MKRVSALNKLAAIPARGLVELFQPAHSAVVAKPQYVSGDLFLQSEALEAVIATADGLTTGLISATAQYVQITCDTITKQVSLPAASENKILTLLCAVTGCELISSVAADKVNTVVVGATNEAALIAGTRYTLVYDGIDNWRMTGVTALGAAEAPVVPDIL
jgi:hypothetical protein